MITRRQMFRARWDQLRRNTRTWSMQARGLCPECRMRRSRGVPVHRFGCSRRPGGQVKLNMRSGP